MANILEILVKLKDEASGKFKTLGKASQQAGLDLKGFAKAAGVASAALGTAAVAFDQTVNTTVDYAKEVRELTQATGLSAEEISRIVQVGDDWGITVEQLRMSLGMMTKNGVVPSIDALAQLADEYQSTANKAEFAEKASKLLGRQWQELIPLFAKGGDALRQQADAIDENLVLTQQQIDAAREYEVALDSLNDKVLELKISAGNELIPQLNILLNNFIQITDYIETQGVSGYQTFLNYQNAMAESMRELGITSEVAYQQLLEGSDEGKKKFLEMKKAVDQANQSVSEVPEIYDMAMSKLREFDIPATDMQEIQDAIALATGKVTEEQLKNRDAVGYLATMLQRKHITWEQFIEALGQIESGAKTAEQVIRDLGRAIDALKNKTVTVTVKYKTTGTPNPAAGDIGLAPGSATVEGPGGWDPVTNPNGPSLTAPKGGTTTTGGVIFTGPINIYIDGAGDPQATGQAVVKALENTRSAGNSGIGFAG